MTENEYKGLSLNEFIVYYKFLNERSYIDINDETSIGYSVLRYLKELKTLRVEFEKNSKELAICKKGLEMACNGDAVVKVWELINGKKAREE